MNYIAALLLLALGRDEEATFWVLACLIDDDDHGVCVCWGMALASRTHCAHRQLAHTL